MMRVKRSELLQLARRGAAQRIREHETEIRRLQASFRLGEEADTTKPPHWAQTPAGRRKISRWSRAAWRKRKAAKK